MAGDQVCPLLAGDTHSRVGQKMIEAPASHPGAWTLARRQWPRKVLSARVNYHLPVRETADLRR